MTDALKTVWHTLATIAPKVLLFLAILAVGYLAARLVARAVGSLLLRAGFNRLLDKALPQPKAMAGVQGNELVAKLAYFAALLLVLQLAFGVFGPNPISALITSVIAYIPRIAVALALIVVATTLAGYARDLIANTLTNLHYGNLLATAAKATIITLGVIAALGQIGVAVTVTQPVLIAALATIAGVLIVGVGGGLIQPAQQRWETYLAKTAAPAAEPDDDRLTHKATIVVTTRELD